MRYIQPFDRAIIDVLVINYIKVKREHSMHTAATGVFTLICGVDVKRQGNSSDVMGPSSGSEGSEKLNASETTLWN